MNEKVSILLSVYKPNEVFLTKQLLSLNNQTYDNLELIVWNDCPQCSIDIKIFNECITNFPFRIVDEHINLGYAKAFEKLVTLADGKYVCFCDQDDIWEEEKVELCVSALKAENGTVAVCDKSIIDENDKICVESVRKQSRWKSLIWSTGDDITSRSIFTCYATGMSIHAKKSEIEKFIPFANGFAHDHWLMAVLSADGKAVYVERPLVQYRRYGKNVTGVLSGVHCKRDYYNSRCNLTGFIGEFEKYFPNFKELPEIKKCNSARMSKNPFRLIRYRRFIPDIFIYEFFLGFCPDFVFKFFIEHFL